MNTGILDKNNKEIKVGDTVECVDHTTGKVVVINSVFVEDGCFCITDSMYRIDDFRTDCIEVIKNPL